MAKTDKSESDEKNTTPSTLCLMAKHELSSLKLLSSESENFKIVFINTHTGGRQALSFSPFSRMSHDKESYCQPVPAIL